MLSFLKINLSVDPNLIKFLMVGVLNTTFGYGIYLLCLSLNLHFSLAITIANILGILFNFKSIGILVFNNKNNNKIFRFVVVYIVIYLCNLVSVGILKSLGLAPWAAGISVLLPLALFSYYLNKQFVFL